VKHTLSLLHHFTKGGCLGPTNYFNLPYFIEVPVLSQESERSCISVKGVEFPLSTFFPIGYWKRKIDKQTKIKERQYWYNLKGLKEDKISTYIPSKGEQQIVKIQYKNHMKRQITQIIVAHIPGLVQALRWKVAGFKQFYKRMQSSNIYPASYYFFLI
jgi:hypothetical protein